MKLLIEQMREQVQNIE
ncbi:MAG: DUF1732 domain-containing protein [Caldilinea sp.]|nr:DUF1732 domain-containing protein [Caldilinea sp.]